MNWKGLDPVEMGPFILGLGIKLTYGKKLTQVKTITGFSAFDLDYPHALI